MAINYSQFPFAPIQKNPMSLLANPAQTAMQQRNSTGLLNLDPMQVQQARMRKGVADAEALNKRQMRGNMFMALGDAFAGREMNSNFLARQQHLQAQKAAEEKRKQGLALGESAYDYILKTTGNADMAMLVKNNPTLANEVIKNAFAKPKDRKIILQNGIQYYADTGEPVLPNAPSPKPPKTTKSDFVVDILQNIKNHVPTEDEPTYELSKSEQNILDTISATDPLEIYKRSIYNQIGLSDPFSDIPTIINEEDGIYEKLNNGDKFIFNGIEYTKGE